MGRMVEEEKVKWEGQREEESKRGEEVVEEEERGTSRCRGEEQEEVLEWEIVVVWWRGRGEALCSSSADEDVQTATWCLSSLVPPTSCVCEAS